MSTKHTCHLALVLMLAFGASGCLEDNPAYLGPAGLRDAARDVAADGKKDGAVSPDVAGLDPDGKVDGIADGSSDGKRDSDGRAEVADVAADLGDGPDTYFADARDAQATDEPSRKDLGGDSLSKDAPDAVADAADVSISEVRADGLPGLDGSAEAGGSPLDGGVDAGEQCPESAVVSCVTPGNPLVGACKAGVRTCSAGAWTDCSDVRPVAETCNGIDDDCNGMVDEGCTEGCIVVCQSCSAVIVDASVGVPYATIEAAISAARGAGAARSRICVASTSCAESTVYESSGPLHVSDGLSIQGNYAMTAAGLVYCGATSQPNTAIKFTGQQQGVVFDETVVGGAELSGFIIQRASETIAVPTSTPVSGAATVAGVVVNGGKNVFLSRIFMTDEPTGTSTAGISITAGGQATVVGSAISGGQGQTSAIGVDVSGGSVELRNNCDTFVGGHCATSCSESTAVLGIRGRTSKSDAAGSSSAVSVSNSSGAASNLVGNTICGGYSNLAGMAAGARVAAVRCDGAGCATVSGNAIAGGTDQEAVGLAISTGSPRVEGNRIEGGCGSRMTTAVLLDGSSASLKNNLIWGGRCAGSGTGASQSSFLGVHIVSSTTTSDPDVHSNDIEPLGVASTETPCQSVGVLVERSAGNASGGSLRNNIIASGICNQRFAIEEASNAKLLVMENNDLYGPDGAVASADPVVLYRRDGLDFTTASAVNSGVSGAKANLSVDPQYTSASDLHLQSGSACLDRGTADGAPSSDYDMVPRPRGAGYDIGAYEK